MSGGLREKLGLPPVKLAKMSPQGAKFGQLFRGEIAKVNGKLRLTAATASPTEHVNLDAQRMKLIEAFQKTSAQIDPKDPAQADPAIQRVMAAVVAVDAKAAAVTENVTAGREQWLEREAEFDDVMLIIGELDDAGHPKAQALQKVGDTIRKQANDRKFPEATKALDQLRPKLNQILNEQKALSEPGAGEKKGIGVPTPIGPVDVPIDIVVDVAKTLFGPRTANCEVLNFTDKTLQFLPNTVVHDWGDFKTFPPDFIPPNNKGNFLTENNSPFTGTEGELRFRIDEQGTTWMVRWNNPRAGDNTAKTQIDGPNKNLYEQPIALAGKGGEANFRYTLKLKGSVPPGPGPVTPGPGPVGPDAASSCHVTITNNTQVTLTLGGQGHERGDFMTFPATTLAPGASTTCVSVETPNSKDPKDEGCKGFLLWQVGSPDVLWRVEWDNPEGAKNVASASFNPPNGGFTSLNQIGQGEENVPTAFTISGAGGGVVPPTTLANQPVRVVDKATAQPVPSVEVTIGNSFETTQNDGKATIAVAPGKYTYKTKAEGFNEATGPVEVVAGDNKELLIELTKGDTKREGLTVLVRDKKTGAGIEGAAVKVGDQSDTTSKVGLATVELPAGKHAFEASATGYANKTGNVDVVEGDNPELVIELEQGDQPRQGLTVFVTDSESKKPIKEAHVKAGDRDDTTSENGLATVELPPGKHDYDVSAQGYQSKKGTVEVVEGDNSELLVELTKGDEKGAAIGVLVADDETGEIIQGADVKLGDDAEKTSENGLAVFSIDPGSYKYDVEAEDYEKASGTVDVKEGDDNELVVRLKKKDSGKKTKVTFLVTDADTGEPLEAAGVMFILTPGDTHTGDTDAAGKAEFEVEAGSVSYAVNRTDYIGSNGVFSVEAGSPHTESVKLKKAGPLTATKVTFLVTNEAGEPIKDAAIAVGADQTGKTDANGNAVFDVEAGNVPFMVEKEGFKSKEDTVDVQEGSNEIVPVVLEKDGEKVEFDPPPESKQPTLRKGAQSADGWVEYLQKMLNKHLGAGTVEVDGNFGGKTFDAVKKFQASTTPPCLIDGVVGNETWSMLRKGEREAVGVTNKGEEKGQEARWATEKTDFVTYRSDVNVDEIWMLAFSVGDTPLDPKTPITVRMSKSDGSGQQAFIVKLGDAEPAGDGQEYILKIPKVAERFGTGDLPVEAYFPKDLGGDLWKGTVPVAGLKGGGGGGGKGGGGKGGGGKGGPPETGTATLEVHVQDPDGNTSAGIKVRITGGPSTVPDGSTDSSGIARFQLLPGEYFVNAAFRAAVWEPGHIKQGSLKPGETFVLTLKKLATSFLEVSVLREGQPEAGATVSVAKAAHAAQKTDGSGNAFFSLPPGNYQVSAVSADGQATGSTSVTVKQGETSSVTMELAGGGGGSEKPKTDGVRVVIFVVDLNQQPISGASVNLNHKEGSPVTTGPLGGAVFGAVPDGTFTATASFGGTSNSKQVVVKGKNVQDQIELNVVAPDKKVEEDTPDPLVENLGKGIADKAKTMGKDLKKPEKKDGPDLFPSIVPEKREPPKAEKAESFKDKLDEIIDSIDTDEK